MQIPGGRLSRTTSMQIPRGRTVHAPRASRSSLQLGGRHVIGLARAAIDYVFSNSSTAEIQGRWIRDMRDHLNTIAILHNYGKH